MKKRTGRHMNTRTPYAVGSLALAIALVVGLGATLALAAPRDCTDLSPSHPRYCGSSTSIPECDAVTTRSSDLQCLWTPSQESGASVGTITVDGQVDRLVVFVRDADPGDICVLEPNLEDGSEPPYEVSIPLIDDRGSYWDFTEGHWCEPYRTACLSSSTSASRSRKVPKQRSPSRRRQTTTDKLRPNTTHVQDDDMGPHHGGDPPTTAPISTSRGAQSESRIFAVSSRSLWVGWARLGTVTPLGRQAPMRSYRPNGACSTSPIIPQRHTQPDMSGEDGRATWRRA